MIRADSRFSRRQFLKASAAAIVMPALVPSGVLGVEAPSQRINLGAIGCGNMGTSNLRSFLAQKDCRVVAACDVDNNHLTHAVGIVNRQYQNKDCKAYRDFRELLARTDIDAVMVATPDHWHELVAVEAAAHKKDIYGEKPLAHTVFEQQAIVRAVHQNQRIWQTGS